MVYLFSYFQRVSKGILKAFGNSTEKLDEELKNKVKGNV